jgi:hypothetical protein
VVAHPRTSLGVRDLRFLNVPAPIQVYAEADGTPLAVRRPSWPRPRRVLHIRETWRIDDEWWRERPLSRLYHDLVLADGTRLVLYQDLLEEGWSEQQS